MTTNPNKHSYAILRAVQDFRDADLTINIFKLSTAPISVTLQDKCTLHIPAFHLLTALQAARCDAIARLDNLGVDTTPLETQK